MERVEEPGPQQDGSGGIETLPTSPYVCAYAPASQEDAASKSGARVLGPMVCGQHLVQRRSSGSFSRPCIDKQTIQRCKEEFVNALLTAVMDI